jgi:Fe-S cluster biogenesis protein NfuA/nitrite reductase/ring-hydroxylating ferredoxin subunit
LMARIQELTERVEKIEDEGARTAAEDLTAAVVQLYGAGLERIVELLGEERSDGEEPLDLLAGDDLVAGLMLIHDLFPVPVEQRVAEALERVRPYMDSHGGDVELLGVRDGVAYLRLEGSCRSCAASSATLELAVRQALEEAAPDLVGMEVEGVAEPAGAASETTGAVLPMAMVTPSGPAPAAIAVPSWYEVDAGAVPLPGGLVGTRVAGAALVIADVEGTLLAYQNACAGCGGALDRGALNGGELACPACGRAFLLPQAGRSTDGALQLDPVPLLRDDEGVRVALAL